MVSPELDATQTAPAGAAAAAGNALAAGMRLDHFRIEKKLGAGGMGEVYLATDIALDRPVAIKVLPPGSSSGTARERLIREARAQARVQHGNVAHIYFIGEDQGRLYFAMEYIEGETLADAIAKGPLSVEAALGVIRAAALGLREAQAHGFFHRDVKPSNLMRDRHGTVKVLDFGLVTGTSGRAVEGPVQQTTLAGTPLYMAPEQARGDAVDQRADIYALGATLYHLIAGKPPYLADSVEQLKSLHASAARPALARRGLPRTQIAAIDSLVTRMMAADPRERFASYDELLTALETASEQHTRPAGALVRGCALGFDLLFIAFTVGLVELPFSWHGNDIRLRMDVVGTPVLVLFTIFAVWRWGGTLGMRIFEIEIASVTTGRRPTLRQATIRTLALAAAPLAIGAAGALVEAAGYPEIRGLFRVAYLLSALALAALTVYAAMRIPGKRPPWDRVAGTLVRYRKSHGTMT